MRDPFRQTSGIGRGSRRMACSLRQGAGNLWTATYWCGGSKACAQTPTTQPHPTTTWQGSACTVCGHVCASAFGLRSHMRRHKETRWAASSSNRRTTKRERVCNSLKLYKTTRKILASLFRDTMAFSTSFWARCCFEASPESDLWSLNLQYDSSSTEVRESSREESDEAVSVP